MGSTWTGTLQKSFRGHSINGVVVDSNSCTNDGVCFAHSRHIRLEQTRWIRGQGKDATGNRFDLVTKAVEQLFVATKVLPN